MEFEYEVKLPNVNHRFGYGDNAINIANFYPIMAVYDGEWNLDPYHSNGDPFYSDLSNYDVTFSCDSKYVLASTGEIIKTSTESEVTRYVLSADAVRDFAMVISDKFQVIDTKYKDVDIKYYFYDDEENKQSLQTALDSIKTFSELYGEYPYKNYSVVQTNFVHGGMEYPRMVYVSDAVTDYMDYKNVIIHETAHQWWYGLVGNNEYDHAWLDEGLTDFSTALFYKHNPSYNVLYEDVIKNTNNSYVTFVDIYTKILGSVETDMTRALNEYNTESEYVYMTYVKGVLLFHNLYETLGEKSVIKSLRKYFAIYKYKNVRPEHLVGSFERVCGCELQSLFNSWVDGKVIIKTVD